MSQTMTQTDGTIPVAVPAGAVAVARWRWTAIVSGSQFFTLEFNWWVGHAIPEFCGESGWTITVDGNPNVQAIIRSASTLERLLNNEPAEYDDKLMSALVLNAAPDVVAAQPGFMRPSVFGSYRR